MLEKLLGLLVGKNPEVDANDEEALRIAVAALLIEAGRMDQRFEDRERQAIRGLLSERFALEGAELDRIFDEAEQRVQGSDQYYPFTSIICRSMDGPQRAQIIEMLWRVVYADGVLDAYEDALIRQVAALIQVDDRERAKARQRALAALGIEGRG
ncbi:MAG: TerB family tellurite resistance protein [Hyphomicrobiaceae bacterium]|nr:TerB family tellurite resistance protein [Hyphomicrobiaceae bacterium]